MVLGGLWHGSNWTFLIWGALHGFGIAINHSIHYFPTSSNLVKKVPTFFWRLLTIAFVIFAWIFFRANNINDAFVIIDGAISSAFIYDSLMQNIFPLFLLLLFAITHYFDSQGQIRLVFKKANKIFLYMIILILWIIVIASATGSSQEFIYFDF